jgi:prophage regulatory protein
MRCREMPKLNPARLAQAPASRYLSDHDLARHYNVNKATVWRWAVRGILPSPVKISDGCTRWRADEIAARDAERDAAR